MKYMGSKNRHAKYILPLIHKAIHETKAEAYVEPFVGGGNLIDKVNTSVPKIANDSHYYLIEMWKALKGGWVPPELVTEDMYDNIRINKDQYDPGLVGYVGFSLSFGGKWFGGYRRDVAGTKGDVNNMKLQSRRAYESIIDQSEKLKSVSFFNISYIDLDIPENSVIYCDPPYAETTGYKDKFDHKTFWEWADIMVEIGNTVFVSEYTAPEHWECIWQKEVTSSLTKDTGSKKAIEKLFTYKIKS
jgi:DNA adenine methylase